MNVRTRRSPRGSGRASRASVYSRRRGSPASTQSPRSRKKRGQQSVDSFLEEMLRHVGGPNAKETLDVIIQVVVTQRRTPSTARGNNSSSSVPMWQHLRAAVAAANDEGLRRVHAAEPAEDVQFFFEKAAKLLEAPPPPPPPPTRRKSVSPMLSQAAPPPSPPAVVGCVEFATFPGMRGYLRGTTLNNKAFAQQAAGEPPRVVVQTLLEAAKERGTVFSTLVLYNLAVALVACEHFDEAVEVVASCTELADAILSADISTSRGSATLFSDFRESVAKHAIMCHTLLAATAAWCELPSVELYHCHLALCCAKKYLPAGSPAAARCARRYAAAEEGTSAIFRTSFLPVMPMLTDDLTQVAHPMFVVFLHEVSAVPPPPSAARCIASVEAVFSSKSEKEAATKLPGLKKRRQMSAKKFGRSPKSVRGRLPAVGRVSSPSSARTFRRSLSKRPSTKRGRAGGTKFPPLSAQLLSEVEALRQAGPSPVDPQLSEGKGLYSIDADASEAPQPMLTLMPEPAFRRYKSLKHRMREMMHSLGHHADDIAGEDSVAAVSPSPTGVQSETITATATTTAKSFVGLLGENAASVRASIHAQLFPEKAPTTAPPPGAYMRIMDKKLMRLSKLAPDPNFDHFLRCIVCVQSLWRGRQARRAYSALLASLSDALVLREAAELVQHAFRNYRATRPFVLERHARAAHRLFISRVTFVQSALRVHASANIWGERCAASYRRRLSARLTFLRRDKAATFIQFWWRVRHALRRRFLAALRVQSAWRGHIARLIARDLRVRRRLAARERMRAMTIAARRVQTFWRGVLLMRAARAEMFRRAKAVAAAREFSEKSFDAFCADFALAPDAARHAKLIFAVLRGHRCRVQCARRLRAQKVLVAFLLRVARRRNAREITLPQLRAAAQKKRAIQKRAEEVADAATIIQSRARGMFARAAFNARRRQNAQLRQMARRLQNALLRFVARRKVRAAVDAARLNAERTREAKRREDSAIIIQSAWRTHAAKKRDEDFRDFLRRGRHRLALIIQCAWRTYIARRERKAAAQKKTIAQAAEQKTQRRIVAAIRAQSVARMFLVRRAQSPEWRKAHATQTQTFRAARCVQCAWRQFAARAYVQQLRLARAFYEQQKINAEAQHTYAVTIQSVVRARLLNGVKEPRARANSFEKIRADAQRTQEKKKIESFALRGSEMQCAKEYVAEWFEEEMEYTEEGE